MDGSDDFPKSSRALIGIVRFGGGQHVRRSPANDQRSLAQGAEFQQRVRIASWFAVLQREAVTGAVEHEIRFLAGGQRRRDVPLGAGGRLRGSLHHSPVNHQIDSESERAVLRQQSPQLERGRPRAARLG